MASPVDAAEVCRRDKERAKAAAPEVTIPGWGLSRWGPPGWAPEAWGAGGIWLEPFDAESVSATLRALFEHYHRTDVKGGGGGGSAAGCGRPQGRVQFSGAVVTAPGAHNRHLTPASHIPRSAAVDTSQREVRQGEAPRTVLSGRAGTGCRFAQIVVIVTVCWYRGATHACMLCVLRCCSRADANTSHTQLTRAGVLSGFCVRVRACVRAGQCDNSSEEKSYRTAAVLPHARSGPSAGTDGDLRPGCAPSGGLRRPSGGLQEPSDGTVCSLLTCNLAPTFGSHLPRSVRLQGAWRCRGERARPAFGVNSLCLGVAHAAVSRTLGLQAEYRWLLRIDGVLRVEIRDIKFDVICDVGPNDYTVLTRCRKHLQNLRAVSCLWHVHSTRTVHALHCMHPATVVGCEQLQAGVNRRTLRPTRAARARTPRAPRQACASCSSWRSRCGGTCGGGAPTPSACSARAAPSTRWPPRRARCAPPPTSTPSASVRTRAPAFRAFYLWQHALLRASPLRYTGARVALSARRQLLCRALLWHNRAEGPGCSSG